MKVTRNGFKSGLQRDLAKLKSTQDSYLDALNMRVITQEGSSSFAIENTKGNRLDITLPNIAAATYEPNGENGPINVPAQSNPVIIGWCILNEIIVIFSATGSGYGQIWTVTYNEATDTASAPVLKYNRNIGFSRNNRIKAFGRYESDKYQRVYFCDDLNPLRTFNIANTNTLDVPYRTLNISPATHFNLPLIKQILQEGNLPNCKLQYFYRLVHRDGAITQFSPNSLLFSLINGNEEGDFQDYPALADDFKEDSQNIDDRNRIEFSSEKAIKIFIPNVDKDYDYIQLGCIQWTIKDVPKVFLFPVVPVMYNLVDAQYNPTGTGNCFEFIHSGFGQGEYTISIEEYNALINTFSVPKTIVPKQSILYTANTENVQFDVDFDARAYRFDSSQDSRIYKENTTTLEFLIDGAAPVYPLNTGAQAVFDAWNPFNDENPATNANWLTNDQYKFRANGITLGGDGPNVSYEFITQDNTDDLNYYNPAFNPTLTVPLAADFQDGIPFVSGAKDTAGATYNNGIPNQVQPLNASFKNLKGPYREATLTGYARGEVYPFALVFEDETGRTSFAKWIGDIKFPFETDVDNLDDYTMYADFNPGLEFLTSNLGIKFYITLPEALQNYSVRIVRMERREQDMTRLGTGVTGTFFLNENPTFTFADFQVLLEDLVYQFVSKLIASNGSIFGFVAGNFFEDQIKDMVTGTMNKITSQAQAIFENNIDGEDIFKMLGSMMKQLGAGAGLFGGSFGVVGFLAEKFGEQIAGYLVEEIKDFFKREVGGIDLKVYSLGHGIGLAGSVRDYGYIISPTVQFNNKYNFRTNDYLRFIYPFDTVTEKVSRVYHRDKKTGALNRTNSTAVYRKWYANNKSNAIALADPNIKATIDKHNILEEGEIVKPTWDNNSTGATYINAYIGYIERYDDNGDVIGLQDFSQRLKVQGIGGRKMLVKLGSNPPAFTGAATLFDAQDNNTGTFYGFDTVIGTATPPMNTGQEVARPRIVDAYGDYIVSIERYIQGQYGGASYSARALRLYNVQVAYLPIKTMIDASDFTAFPIACWNGDTWVGVYDAVNYAYYFDQLPGYEKSTRTKKALADIFPCECPFNFNIREGKHFARSQDTDSLDVTEGRIKRRIKRLQRKAKRTGIDAAKATELILPKRFLFDEFIFNDVFTQQSNARIYPAKPVIDLFVDHNFNRIWKSQPKIDGELMDSWRQFKAADFMDVEGIYGPINEITSFRDSLVFYQTRAFGIATTNERATSIDGKGNTLAIASSVPLSRFDYISTETGCFHRFGVVTTNSSLFHFDVNTKKMFKYDNGLQPLSDIEGLSGFFRQLSSGNLVDTDRTIASQPVGIHGEYNPELNTVYFTFLDNSRETSTSYTLSYNLVLQAFDSFHSFKPGLYLRTANRLLSSNRDNKAYSHEKGNYGEFYGTKFDSYVTFRVNENPFTTKSFDNHTIFTEVIDSTGANLPNETINFIQATNDSQDTGVIPFIVYPAASYNIRKRERAWHFNIPRDSGSAAYTTLKPRMKDVYNDSTFIFTNNNNKRFILHDILTAYNESKS